MTSPMVDPLAEVALVRDHIQAFSDRDWEAYRSLLHPEACYQEFGAGRMAVGRDEVVAMVRAWTYPFPDLRGEILREVTCGSMVVAELRWMGTFAAAVPTPLGRIEPTGRRGLLHTVVVFNFQEGLIREMRHYFDLTEALRSAGALPAA